MQSSKTLLSVVSSAFVLILGSISAKAAQPELPIVNGEVTALARLGNTLFIGGGFDTAGPASGQMIVTDPVSGARLSGWPRVAGDVHAIISDGANGWYIGGDIMGVGGERRGMLAHIRADGSLDPAFDPQADDTVKQMILQGSTLYVAGQFENIGGKLRSHIAALDVNTGLATSFAPGSNGEVLAIALDGNTLYAGGYFSSNGGLNTSFGGQKRDYIAAVDTATGNATGWNPGAKSLVQALALQDGVLYAGGSFSGSGSIAGADRNYIAAIDTVTGAANAWDPNANGPIYALATAGDTVYAGGSFTTINSVSRKNVAAIAVAGGTPTAFNPAPDNAVRTILHTSTAVYLGGTFDEVAGVARPGAVAVDAATGALLPWNSKVDSSVYAIAKAESGLALGGTFAIVDGVTRKNAAAIDLVSGTLTDWNPAPDEMVMALALHNSTVYLGGYFEKLGSIPRSHIAAVDTALGAPAAFNPVVTGSEITSLALGGDTLYMGGVFSGVASESRSNAAAVSLPGGELKAWAPAVDERIMRLAVDGTTIYMVGDFTSVGGTPRGRIASVDSSGTLLPWDPSANSDVYGLYVAPDVVYVGGNFSAVGGKLRTGVAALDKTTGLATAFNLQVYGFAVSIAPFGENLILGGEFFDFSDFFERSFTAATIVDRVTGRRTLVLPHCYGLGYTFDVSGGQVIMGGEFITMNNQPLRGIADISPLSNSLIPATPTGTPKDGETLTTSDNGGWIGTGTMSFSRLWERCGASGTGCAALSGQTAETYVPGAADVGSTLRVSVTATDATASLSAESATTAVIAPKNTKRPAARGRPEVGQTLLARDGAWNGVTEMTITRQWKRCNRRGASCRNIKSARSLRYRISKKDVGYRIVVAVRASKNGSQATEALSSPTAKVKAAR